jgi:methylase of polypeptide subunit release factors
VDVMAKPLQVKTDRQKTIVSIFNELTRSGRHSRWTIWSDFVAMSACALSLADTAQLEQRRKMYDDASKKYSKNELERFSAMFEEVVDALEENPEQDFLGELFMAMELGNEHNGQFFTPYPVCKAMAMISADNLETLIERKGYASVNDCCCGAGALLIALANEARRQGVNYQERVMFVAQDVDFTAAMMCYIQLSLLGCPGYVIVGNALSTPPTEPLTNQNVWYTPFYFRDIWHYRRVWKSLSELCRVSEETASIEPQMQQSVLFGETKAGQLTLF